MLCEKCKKNEAKVNLITVINGEKHEVWLCENCVKDISNVPFFSSIGKNEELTFQGMLTEILSSVGSKVKADSTSNVNEIVCPNCGLNYDEFKKTGRLGCPDCYVAFKVVLEPRIKSLQAGVKHIGKIPHMKGEEIVRRRKLKDLKAEMQKLIVTEEYERAAVVRDEIKKMELYILESNINKEPVHVKEENCDGQFDS